MEQLQDMNDLGAVGGVLERASFRSRRRTPRRFSAVRRARRLPARRARPISRLRRTPPRFRKRRPVRVVRRTIPGLYPRDRVVYKDLPLFRKRPTAILSHFLNNSAELRATHLPQVRQIARHIISSWRTSRPVRVIHIVGHTDNTGSMRCTQRMGLQRARAARRRLRSEINKHWPGLQLRINMIVYTAGAKNPLASNRSGPGRAFNRRVAIYFSRI